jgi:tetratricopeptide (TPR) repeat protein
MRHELIGSLTRQFSAVTSRRVSLALGLWGEPGIGKTHTVQAVFQHLSCAHLSLHATASAAQMASSLPRARTLPAWAVAQLERMGGGETMEDRAVVQTLATALSALAPFVLHLEDLHEATAECVALVDSLARAVLRSRGVGLLVTSRAELPEPFRNHHLEGLSRVETAVLLEQELRARPPEDGLEWVFGRTRGNPLFTLEFVRYLRRQGFLWSDGERWHWRSPAEDFVPVTIEALVLNLASSIAGKQEIFNILEARSILPDGLESKGLESLWSQVANVDVLALREARQQLEHGGMLRGDDFAHPLFAEVIVSEIGSDARRSFAQRAIEVTRANDPELAARFVTFADLEPQEAIKLLRLASNGAAVQGDETQSGRWLAVASELASGADRMALAFDASKLLGNRDIKLATQLAEQAHDAPSPPLELSVWLAELLMHQGQSERAEALLRARPSQDHGDQRWWEQMVRILGRRDSTTQKAIALWRTRPEQHESVFARTALVAAAALRKHEYTAEAGLIHDSLLRRDQLSANERSDVLHDLAMIAYFRSDFLAVEQHLLEAIAIERTINHPYSLAETLRKLASTYVRLGRHSEAMKPIQEATSIAFQGGHSRVYAICLGTLGTLLMQQGEFEQVELLFRERREIMERFGNGFYLYDAHADLALLYLEWRPPHGRPLAVRHAQTALNWAERNRRETAVPLAHLARAWLDTGAVELALETARKAVNVASNPEETACARLALGITLRTAGRGEEAIHTLETAERNYEQLGMRYMAQRSGLELDFSSGDRTRALGRRAWFESEGLHGGRVVADRLFIHQPLREFESVEVRNPSNMTARLNVLGPVTLERDGQTVPSRAKKRLELLAYLLETRVAGRGEASALELVDAFYAGTAEPEAKNTLKQQIYLIRSSFGAESIISTATGYALGAVSSDAEDFLRGGDSSLWRGAYLGGLSDGFHASVREALTLALHGKIEELLEVNPREAARLGVMLLDMEPYDAEILRLSVQALERSGASGAARRTFSEGRARLTEIGEAVPELASEFLTIRAIA